MQPGAILFTAAEYDRLYEICLTKPLRRNMLSLSRVTLSRAIQVHNIGDVTGGMMMLYFENKRSGGGHVTSVRFSRDDDCAVLELQEHSSKLHHPHQVEYRAMLRSMLQPPACATDECPRITPYRNGIRWGKARRYRRVSPFARQSHARQLFARILFARSFYRLIFTRQSCAYTIRPNIFRSIVSPFNLRPTTARPIIISPLTLRPSPQPHTLSHNHHHHLPYFHPTSHSSPDHHRHHLHLLPYLHPTSHSSPKFGLYRFVFKIHFF